MTIFYDICFFFIVLYFKQQNQKSMSKAPCTKSFSFQKKNININQSSLRGVSIFTVKIVLSKILSLIKDTRAGPLKNNQKIK